ncbi:hypothetical protein [Synechococcus sp. PCC 7502]
MIANYGLVVDSLKTAADLSNLFAPEHLELVKDYHPTVIPLD